MLLAGGTAALLIVIAGVQALLVQRSAGDLRADLRAAAALGTPTGRRALAGTAAGQAPGAAAEARRVTELLGRVRSDSHRLAGRTRAFPLSLATRMPLVGADARTVRDLAADADLLSAQVLPVLADAGLQVLTSARSGPLDLRALTSRADRVTAAARTAHDLARRGRTCPARSAPVRAACAQVTAHLDGLDRLLRPVGTLTTLGAGMTGEHGPRRYLVVLQTPAESRATGGLVGGYVEVVVDAGAVRVVRRGANTDLQDGAQDAVALPGGFDETWGSWGAERRWSSSNLSPDFPRVATVWAALYGRQHGVTVDGVVGVTPEALAPLLAALPAVTLADGTPVTGDSVVGLLERGVYARFPSWGQEAQRRAFQQDVLRRLLDAVTVGGARPVDQVRAVLAATRTGGVHLASTHLPEQVELEAYPLAGALPRTDRPFVAWTTQNVSGSKLDVYLHRALSYRRRPLDVQRQQVTATVALRNDAPVTGLPAYVTGLQSPAGTHLVLVSTYLTAGAHVRSVTVDGRPVTATLSQEQGHPVVLVQVRLEPGGGTGSVVVTADEVADPRPVTTLRQLVANPDVLDGPLLVSPPVSAPSTP